MKVICIKSFAGTRSVDNYGIIGYTTPSHPQVGECYTITGHKAKYGREFFKLAEYPGLDWWDKDFFAEVPDNLEEEIKEALNAPAPIKREIVEV